MTQVFISHSDSAGDKKFVQKLIAALSGIGITSSDMLSESDVLLLVISKDSMASSDVRAEWQQFYNAQKPIIHLQREITSVPTELMQGHFAKVDFVHSDFEASFDRLSQIIHHHSAGDLAASQSISPYIDFLDYLIEITKPEQILSFKTSEVVQIRAAYLLECNAEGTLTSDEKRELDEFLEYDRLVSLLKAKARRALKQA